MSLDVPEGLHLVTGATGFIGAAVVRALLAAGARVRVLVREGSDRRNLDGLDVEPALGDLRAPESLAPALAGCRGLFHVAADYRLWVRNPGAMFDVNVGGTQAILRAAAAAGVERAVYTSSVAVLGTRDDGTPTDEDTPVAFGDMVGAYKQSKFRAEEAAREVIAETGLDCVIVNPSTPVGPGDVKPTPTGRLLVEAAAGRMPAYVDTGLNVVHVDDVASGHLLACAKGAAGERYVLGGDDLSLREILTIVAGITGGRPPVCALPRWPLYPLALASEAWYRLRGSGEPFATVDGLRMSRSKMFFSSAKAERELGYTHRPAQQALSDAVRWFKENGYLH